MMGFALKLPIEDTAPRQMRVSEDVMLPTLDLVDGPMLVITLTQVEAIAVRAWLTSQQVQPCG